MKTLEGLSVLIVLALGLAVAGFLALEALATVAPIINLLP